MNKKIISTFAICFVFMLVSSSLPAQEKPQSSISTYKLDYVFSELQDNKRINTRSYTVLLRLMDRGSIRLGDRVPIVAGSSKEGVSQFQYLDVGMNIDCRVEPASESDITLFTNVENTSAAPEQPSENRTGSPVLRQVRYQMENVVPLNKQILLGSADEVNGTRRFQIEVTATKVR
jgi:hypothetical protein